MRNSIEEVVEFNRSANKQLALFKSQSGQFLKHLVKTHG